MKNKFLLVFARALPYLFIVGYIAGLLGSIAIGRYNYAVIGSILAIPAIAGALATVYIYRANQDSISKAAFLFHFRQRTLFLIFGILFALTIALGQFFPAESPYFLGGIIGLYSVVLLQIFSKGHRPTITLIEIMLTMACLIYVTTLKAPYYFGGTDINSHIFISTVTYLSGHIVPPDMLSGYEYFPLYHIWITLSSYVLAIDIKTSLFLITCPVYVLVIVFLYYLFKRATGNIQISLLACLLYSVDSTVTYYGAYMITRAAAYVGFAILLYLLINRDSFGNSKNRNISFYSLCLLVTVYILLVHQVSTPMILFLLILLMACEWYVGSEKRLWSSFFVFELLAFLAYWFYVAYDFTNFVGVTRFSPEVFEAPVIMESVQQYSPLSFLSNNVDTVIFLFFAIVGIGYLLRKQKPAYALVLGLFSLLMMALYVPTPLTTLWQTMTLFRLDRFALLVSPFMAFIMSWGLFTVSRYFQKSIPIRVAGSVVVLIFVVYCCATLGIFNAESPGYRNSFTSEELDGFDDISSHVPYGSTIYSDYFTSRYFNLRQFSESDSLGIPFYQSYPIGNAMDLPSYRGFVIIPQRQLMRNGLTFREGTELDSEGGLYSNLPSDETIATLSNNLGGKSKIFSSEFIDLYHS